MSGAGLAVVISAAALRLRQGYRRECVVLALTSAILNVGVLALAAGPASAGPGSAPAGVVRIAFPKDDGTLTPYTFELGYPLVSLIYDTVTWRDAEGVPRPWLARSVDTGDGGRRVTIRLRTGIKWQDGQPLTAADVVFTFRFVASHRHPRFTPELADVESVQALDAETVAITLRHPSLGFLDQPLADVPILPEHLWSHLPSGMTAPPGLPVGSGPYRLVAHNPGQFYRLSANPAYFLGPPRVGRIDVPIIGTFERTLAALDQRLVDVTPFSLPKAAAQRLEGDDVHIRTGPSYLGTVLMFNLRRPPFSDIAARRAVAEAVNLGVISQAIGHATPADHGYLHPASPWASPSILQHQNIPAARSALARLGLRRLAILAPDGDPVRREAGRQVVLALRQVGVQAMLMPLGADALSKAVGENGASPAFDAAIWSAPPLASYDPDFLPRVFGSHPGEAPLNYSGYASPAFDGLAADVASSASATARQRAAAQELRLLSSDLPVLPLVFADGAFPYRPSAYDGWAFVKGAGILDKRSFLVDQASPPGGSGALRTRARSSGSSALLALSLLAGGLLAAGVTVAVARRRGIRAP